MTPSASHGVRVFNRSPPLAWSDLPAGTIELALLFENITPQTKEPFVQWLVYKIPPDRGGLPEGYKHKADPKEPVGVLHGRNSLGNVGYDGPLGTLNRPAAACDISLLSILPPCRVGRRPLSLLRLHPQDQGRNGQPDPGRRHSRPGWR